MTRLSFVRAFSILAMIFGASLSASAEDYDYTDIARCSGVMLFTAEMSSMQGDEVGAKLIKDRVRGGFIASTALMVADGWAPEKAVESFENWKLDGMKAASISPEFYEKMGADCLAVLEYQAKVLNTMRREGQL